MANETLAQLARCLDALEYRYDLDEEQDCIRTSFNGANSPYWVSVRAAAVPEARLLRLRAYVSLREHNVPILAVTPSRLDEANRFINYVNGRWMDAGHLFLDPNDGDLSFDWAVPVTSDLTPEFADFLLRFLRQVDHFFPDVWAILVQGMTAIEAIVAHKERDEAAGKPPVSGDREGGAAADDADETFPFPA